MNYLTAHKKNKSKIYSQVIMQLTSKILAPSSSIDHRKLILNMHIHEIRGIDYILLWSIQKSL